MPQRILIAEDEAAIRELLVAVWEDEGYRVATAWDGRAALAVLSGQRYDVVLSNVMMPRMDGCELANAMHADPALRDIPVILMSAAGPRLLPQVPHAAFVPKPFDIAHLLAVVADVLALTTDRAGS
jgi:CheY-like chemotaxis protein